MMRAMFVLLCLCCAGLNVFAQSAEVRGVWIARDSLTSRAEIRAMMQQMAEANLNLALPVLRKVLECASPLALSSTPGVRKRQRTAAVQDADAASVTGRWPLPRSSLPPLATGRGRVLIGADGFRVRNGTRHE